MTKQEYSLIENYMHDCMKDSAHDRLHIYRVLSTALEIAGFESSVNYDVLIAACLLHDIGRELQFKNPEIDHAEIGAEMAYDFLSWMGWSEEEAMHVSACVLTHRYRKSRPPESIEARILFDADKLDVSGAMGIARTLIYGAQVSEPLYTLSESGEIVCEATDAHISSFFQEFEYKQRKLYSVFFTKRAQEIGDKRKKAAYEYRDNLFSEVSDSIAWGHRLDGILSD